MNWTIALWLLSPRIGKGPPPCEKYMAFPFRFSPFVFVTGKPPIIESFVPYQEINHANDSFFNFSIKGV
jgi:hypothetical protein